MKQKCNDENTLRYNPNEPLALRPKIDIGRRESLLCLMECSLVMELFHLLL